MEFIKAKIKKIIVAVIVVMCAGSFFACSSGVEVFESADADNWNFNVYVCIDKTMADALDFSAAQNEQSAIKAKWTIRQYLVDYFEAIAIDRDMTVAYSGREVKNGNYRYLFELRVSKKGNMAQAFELKGEKSSEYGVSGNLFMREYSVDRENRFNYFQRQFAESYERSTSTDVNIKLEQDDYQTEMGILLNGKRDYYADKTELDEGDGFIYDERFECCYKQILPPLSKAFPLLSMADYGNFYLDNYWPGSSKMKVSSDEKFNLENGMSYYLFHKTMSDGETNVQYTFLRAVSTGWYLVALLGGGFTVLGILLFCKLRDKKKKPKTDVRDLFPYDPFA